MTKISTKELIICIIAIISLILALTTDTFATTPSLNELLNDANTANEFNTIPEGNNTSGGNLSGGNLSGGNLSGGNLTGNNTSGGNLSGNNRTNSNTANNVKANNTVIPDAGLDQSIGFIIAIFGISAVYAYKKIRDYKNV